MRTLRCHDARRLRPACVRESNFPRWLVERNISRADLSSYSVVHKRIRERQRGYLLLLERGQTLRTLLITSTFFNRADVRQFHERCS